MALSVASCSGFPVEAFVEVSKEATTMELPPLFGIQVDRHVQSACFDV